MPRAHVHHGYRTQLVDLQPYGNTISIEADSDNPYESDEDVEVVTQESGGMSGPDPHQRSKRVMHKGTAATARPHAAGMARTFRTHGAANRQGFMPGFGGFGDLGVDTMLPPDDSGGGGSAPAVDTTDFAALTALQDPGYMGAAAPGMAPIPVNQTQGVGPAPTPATAAQAAAATSSSTPSAPGTSAAPGYLSALNALVGAGAKTTQAVLAAKQKAAVVAPPKGPISALGAQAKAYWPYLAAGVGAVVVLGLLFGGGSRSSTVVMSTPAPAKTNPRHRRR